MISNLEQLAGERIAIKAVRTTRWPGLGRWLFNSIADKAMQIRRERELTSLPDHMLLDIGIDPRSVPNPAGEMLARPDLALHRRTVPAWRSTVRS